MEEVWKDIVGYEGIYQVGSFGKVKNVRSGQIRKPIKDKDGYYQLKLHNCDRGKTFKLHRLVAEAFIEHNKDNDIVNHKDENKRNNCVDNLEWCNAGYNNSYGSRKLIQIKAVNKIEISTGKVVARYKSISEAARLNDVAASSISKACSSDTKTLLKHKWVFAS